MSGIDSLCRENSPHRKPIAPPSEPPQWFIDIWSTFEKERATEIPNRLHGAAINAEGDAI